MEGCISAFSTVVLLVPEADKDEGRDARDFPEYKEQNEIVRQGDPKHGGHEGDERRVVLAEAGVVQFGNIGDGVDAHTGADSGNEQGEKQAPGIRLESEVDVKSLDPARRVNDDVFVAFSLDEEPQSGKERRDRR